MLKCPARKPMRGCCPCRGPTPGPDAPRCAVNASNAVLNGSPMAVTAPCTCVTSGATLSATNQWMQVLALAHAACVNTTPSPSSAGAGSSTSASASVGGASTECTADASEVSSLQEPLRCPTSVSASVGGAEEAPSPGGGGEAFSRAPPGRRLPEMSPGFEAAPAVAHRRQRFATLTPPAAQRKARQHTTGNRARGGETSIAGNAKAPEVRGERERSRRSSSPVSNKGGRTPR